MQIENQKIVQCLRKIRNLGQDRFKYYRFHKEVGHTTDDRYQLKEKNKIPIKESLLGRIFAE